MADKPKDSLAEIMNEKIAHLETRKRRRERRVAFAIGLLFFLSTLLQAFLTDRGQNLGFYQSLLYFGLVHLNVILIMFLVFLVSRTLIKAYLLRKTRKLGSSLRWKLVTSLLAFSLLPSIVLFAGSSLVIRQGFDKWFGGQVFQALEDAQAITDVHYKGLEDGLVLFSERIQERITKISAEPSASVDVVLLQEFLKEYPVQMIELYVNSVDPPLRVTREGVMQTSIPRASVESIQRAAEMKSSFTLIRQFGDGDLVQRFIPVMFSPAAYDSSPKSWLVVVSQIVPLGLKSRISDLRSAFAGYTKTVSLKQELKTNYTLVLLTLFLVTLFVVSWFGLYIAKAVTEPVGDLMKATEAFREGNWSYRIPKNNVGNVGVGEDLEVLKGAFNLMAEEVGKRGRQLEEANGQLISLVRELEDRERYLEILLASIRRGVVVLDTEKRIQRINSEALEFSNFHEVNAQSDSEFRPGIFTEVLGRPWHEIFSGFGMSEDLKTWLDECLMSQGNPLDRIFEAKVGTGSGSSIRSVRTSGIGLLDDRNKPLGWMIILEDVSDAARLEKLAAWQEVAKRVAHEIKNPLTPIQISSDRLLRRMRGRMESDPVDGPVFLECLGQIQKQVRVIRDLVREFSQFAKLPEPQMADLELKAFFQNLVNDYRFTHPGCSFDFAVDGDLNKIDAWVRGDPEYLRRLAVNLADNAIQSMEEAQVAQPFFKIKLGHTPLGFWEIAFEDNGPGVPITLREKIFDPYVSSKASGLGLGLPIVRRIAIEHGGRIRCEGVESGARFVLELPKKRNQDIVQDKYV